MIYDDTRLESHSSFQKSNIDLTHETFLPGSKRKGHETGGHLVSRRCEEDLATVRDVLFASNCICLSMPYKYLFCASLLMWTLPTQLLCWKLQGKCSKSHFPPAKHGLGAGLWQLCKERRSPSLGVCWPENLKCVWSWKCHEAKSIEIMTWKVSTIKRSITKSMSWTPHHAATVLQALVNWHVLGLQREFKPTTTNNMWQLVAQSDRIVLLLQDASSIFKYLQVTSTLH